MSVTWYEASYLGNTITPIEVNKETDKQVQVVGVKCSVMRAKETQYGSLHPTWEEARSALMRHWDAQRAEAQKRAEHAIHKLTYATYMVQP